MPSSGLITITTILVTLAWAMNSCAPSEKEIEEKVKPKVKAEVLKTLAELTMDCRVEPIEGRKYFVRISECEVLEEE